MSDIKDTIELSLDASGVETGVGRARHSLESLGNGDTLRFINDHEPLPLLAQIARRYGDQVRILPVTKEEGRYVFDLTIALSPCSGGCGEGGCGGHGEGGCAHSDED
jgi:uncharacterized protein (DUF2249 family)